MRLHNSYSILLITSLLCCKFVNSQQIDYDWKRLLGDTLYGNYGTSAHSIAVDSLGNIYIGGGFEKKLELEDTTYLSNSTQDGFLLKLDSSGKTIWSKHFARSRFSTITSVKVDRQNELIIAGHYMTMVSFDTTLITPNTDTTYSQNAFVAKLDTDGNLKWAKNTNAISFKLSIDESNQILLAGKCLTNLNYFDTVGAITTIDSIWVSFPWGSYWSYFHPSSEFFGKLDTQGNKLFIKEIGGPPNEIQSDNQNNIWITGHFSGTKYFDTTQYSAIGTTSIYLAKYSPSGNIKWIGKAGGSAENYGMSLAIDTTNSIYLSCQTEGNNVYFNNTLCYNFATEDAIIAKYDSSGNFKWYKKISSSSASSISASGTTIRIDKNSNLVLTGTFWDSLILGSTILINQNGLDLMLIKLDLNGNYIASGQDCSYFGHGGAYDMAFGPNSEIYLTGHEEFNINNTYYDRILIEKIADKIPTYSVSGVEEVHSLLKVEIFPNPVRDQLNFHFYKNVKMKMIRIMDLMGKQVALSYTTAIDHSLNLYSLQNGIYFVQIVCDGELIVRKFIKN